jgi:hypothetical protein
MDGYGEDERVIKYAFAIQLIWSRAENCEAIMGLIVC